MCFAYFRAVFVGSAQALAMLSMELESLKFKTDCAYKAAESAVPGWSEPMLWSHWLPRYSSAYVPGANKRYIFDVLVPIQTLD
jgi:hypothetical protein